MASRETRWRVGSKNPHALYKDDQPAGFIRDAVDALEIVEAMNHEPRRNPFLGRWRCRKCTSEHAAAEPCPPAAVLEVQGRCWPAGTHHRGCICVRCEDEAWLLNAIVSDGCSFLGREFQERRERLILEWQKR